jgi:hypothetical protein
VLGQIELASRTGSKLARLMDAQEPQIPSLRNMIEPRGQSRTVRRATMGRRHLRRDLGKPGPLSLEPETSGARGGEARPGAPAARRAAAAETAGATERTRKDARSRARNEKNRLGELPRAAFEFGS